MEEVVVAQPKDKVFGVGFHKTGTKSLAQAFERLGYNVTGPNGFRVPNIADRYKTICRRYSKRYDAFQDNPWPLTFKEMSVMWPEAKFILTLRNKDDWLKSVIRHFGKVSTPMRELIYGVGAPIGNEEVYLERYQRHEDEVRSFFSTQKNRLLVMRITDGEGYEKLCPFLGAEVPDDEFPHNNKALL